MNRTTILVLGAMAWTSVALDAAVHIILGDVVVPAGMALVFVGWVGFRLVRPARVAVPA
jgi:hypothetical protein